MIQRIQMLPRGQRIVIFALFMVGGLLAILAVTVFLFLITANTAQRNTAVAQLQNIAVQEFAQLPDEDSYPAAVAIAPDGTIYTGSYASGAIWRITPTGEVTEVPNTREVIGSVSGLEISADGTVFILDRTESDPRAAGGIIWQIDPQRGFVVEFGEGIDDNTGFVSPDDITLDPNGNVYVSDRGRREIWVFTPEGIGVPWWVVPQDDDKADSVVPTGLTYDSFTDSILITDSEAGTIYRVSLDSMTTEIVYRAETGNPGFDGITTTLDGKIYVAALGDRAVMQVAEGTLITLANNFRGVSDVAYGNDRLYATNFDQRGLVLPGIEPQLPFALDVITFNEE